MTTTDLITNPCIGCGERTTLEVDLESYMSWRDGTLIQSAFPNSTSGYRELLQTGIHEACWDSMMGTEEE